MKLCNDTVTVFTASADAATKTTVYAPTVIAGVSWHAANADAVDSIIGDYYGMLGLGLVDDPDATLDEMLDKCYKAGLQDIYDEMYKQYNAWLASR